MSELGVVPGEKGGEPTLTLGESCVFASLLFQFDDNLFEEVFPQSQLFESVFISEAIQEEEVNLGKLIFVGLRQV